MKINFAELFEMLKKVILNKNVIIVFAIVLIYLEFVSYIVRYRKRKRVKKQKVVVAAPPSEEGAEETTEEAS